VTQIDLPAPKRSGRIEARQIVQGIRGTEFVHFDERDVVRHPLVQRIVLAYERHGQASENGRGLEADAAAVSRARVSETRPTPAADAARGETEDDR